MSIHIRKNLYQDGLTKFECVDCLKEFIVGTYIAEQQESSNLICPYCGSDITQPVAEMNEDYLADLGCMGIYYELEE